MDPAWISAITGARTVDLGRRIQSLWGGYGEIRRVRLDGRPAVAKAVTPPTRGDASHQRKLRSYDVELAWYQHYAVNSPSRVPKFIGGAKHDGGWTIVLEDLDVAGYAGRRGNPDHCLAWLARFHLHYLGTPPAHLWSLGTYWHLETRQAELEATADSYIRDAAPVIAARLRESSFRTIVHGDAKVANFCFGEDGVAAVDFQYVGAGCAMSDVAYLICGDPDEGQKLDRYCHHLRIAGGTAGLETEARRIYPIAAADFYRFYAGWAPSRWASEVRGQQVIRSVLSLL